MRKAIEKVTQAVPKNHMYMMYLATGMTVFAGSMYAFVPKDRANLFEMIALTGAGFLFGKFTNGFKSREEK